MDFGIISYVSSWVWTTTEPAPLAPIIDYAIKAERLDGSSKYTPLQLRIFDKLNTFCKEKFIIDEVKIAEIKLKLKSVEPFKRQWSILKN